MTTTTPLACRVCAARQGRYRCPRCNAPYCSTACYKSHGGQCTEAFYREAATQELQGTRASPAEARRMMEILQRMHLQQSALDGADPAGPGSEDEEEDGAEEGEELAQQWLAAAAARAGLAPARLAQLLEEAEAQAGDWEPGADVLTPEEAQAFMAALQGDDPPGPKQQQAQQQQQQQQQQQGQPAAPAAADPAHASRQPPAAAPPTLQQQQQQQQQWAPWWSSAAAAQLRLSPLGLPLVLPTDPKGGAQGEASAAAGAGACQAAAAADALPPLPQQPLRPLSEVARVTPSPLLPWQLLQLLFSYCLLCRRARGALAPGDVAPLQQLLALTPHLLPPPSRQSCGGGDIRELLPVPESASVALAQSTELCHAPQAGLPGGSAQRQQAALEAAQGAGALLQLGRSSVLLALHHVHAWVATSRTQLKQQQQQQDGIGSPGAAKQFLQQLQAVAQKLAFLQCWANEQPEGMYLAAALATAAEHQRLAAAAGSVAGDDAGAVVLLPGAAGGTGRAARRPGAAAATSGAARRGRGDAPLVTPLDASTTAAAPGTSEAAPAGQCAPREAPAAPAAPAAPEPPAAQVQDANSSVPRRRLHDLDMYELD